MSKIGSEARILEAAKKIGVKIITKGNPEEQSKKKKEG